MYQQAVFANGEFYHVVNRGVEKRTTFLDKRDHTRFIETLYYYRFKDPPSRFSFRDRVSFIGKAGSLNKQPLVEIVCFCLMPNHFHLLLKQVEDRGITTFLSKVSNSYTKYFNLKNRGRVGPLFQGAFKAVRIEDDEQLVHVSRYIHLNPLIDYLVKDLKSYQYSSYLEFVRGGGNCKRDYVLSHFGSITDYKKFILDQEDYGRSVKLMERVILDADAV